MSSIRELEEKLKAYEQRWVQQDMEILSQTAMIEHLRNDLAAAERSAAAWRYTAESAQDLLCRNQH